MLTVLQQGFKPRDPRIKVLLPSRMRVGSTWTDACIHNVSSRGLLVASDETPKLGSYVEIRRGQNIIIGRAVWVKDRFFGVRTQDHVDLVALQQTQTRARPDANARGQIDRRRDDRFKIDAAVARTLERNRALSRMMQFGLIAVAAVAASTFVAVTVHYVLEEPMARIQRAMAGQP